MWSNLEKFLDVHWMQKIYEHVTTCIVENMFMENLLKITKVKYYTWSRELKLLVTASVYALMMLS